LCPQCQRRHDDLDAKRLGREAGVATVPVAAGPGCDHCKHTGYVGRIPVAEVLAPNDRLREAICGGATASELRAALHGTGWRSMRDRALALVAAGITSLDEVNRVLAPEHSAATTAVRTGEKPKILVVEDDRITRMLVRLLLEKEGYEVLEGENGHHAIDMAHRDRPDLLIIDLHMPEMDGYEAITRIRRDISLATLPVMVLTAETGPGVEHRVLEMGADDYAVKPFEPAVLLARVGAAFRRMGRASEAA
jgi:CheY-like chemotaxis protein